MHRISHASSLVYIYSGLFILYKKDTKTIPKTIQKLLFLAWLGFSTGPGPATPAPSEDAPDSLTRTQAHGSSSTCEVGTTLHHSHRRTDTQASCAFGRRLRSLMGRGTVSRPANREDCSHQLSARVGPHARARPLDCLRGVPPLSEEMGGGGGTSCLSQAAAAPRQLRCRTAWRPVRGGRTTRSDAPRECASVAPE